MEKYLIVDDVYNSNQLESEPSEFWKIIHFYLLDTDWALYILVGIGEFIS